jgi:pyruvate formate lyase activating enzyme
MTKDCIDMITPYLDAANVDLKSFSDKFYRDSTSARLKPVLENISYLKKKDIWVEVTTLLIPGLNDSIEEIKEIAGFIKSIGEEIPWHISAYYPRYKSKIAPTEVVSIKRAIDIAREIGLLYVYGGNIYGNDYESTFCPRCREVLITRTGYFIAKNNIDKGRCRNCGEDIKGVFY